MSQPHEYLRMPEGLDFSAPADAPIASALCIADSATPFGTNGNALVTTHRPPDLD